MPTGPEGQKRPAGVTEKLWSMDDLIAMMDAEAPKPGPRGRYKKCTSDQINER